MPVPPLGDTPLKLSIPRAFEVMDQLNKNRSLSRIENVTLDEIAEVASRELTASLKSWDYLYERTALSGLKGDRYKEKRWGVNQFVKNHPFEYRPFVPPDVPGCLALYDQWKERKKKGIKTGEGEYEIHLLEDSRSAHFRMMREYQDLGLIGRVVTVGSEIKGYLMGADLSPDLPTCGSVGPKTGWIGRFQDRNEKTLAVLAEVTDLSVRGLAQFIFREFCLEQSAYPWINTMDDSDLLPLRKVKNSYRPFLLVPSYTLEHRIHHE
jgi:hypothetical protein